jgi:hypothetical protein
MDGLKSILAFEACLLVILLVFALVLPIPSVWMRRLLGREVPFSRPESFDYLVGLGLTSLVLIGSGAYVSGWH